MPDSRSRYRHMAHEARHIPGRSNPGSGTDIKALGILFVVAGVADLIWILSYPDYALKVFGTTFAG